jgi:hypothetical protein
MDQNRDSVSNGALRTRAHRLRRKRGVRLVRIAVNATEIGMLVELGYLALSCARTSLRFRLQPTFTLATVFSKRRTDTVGSKQPNHWSHKYF